MPRSRPLCATVQRSTRNNQALAWASRRVRTPTAQSGSTFDPDRDWPRQVGLEIYVKDQRGRYFTQLTRQRYPDFETAKREAETLARTDPARWPPEAPWPDPDMPPARRNRILAQQAAVERVIAAGELTGRPVRAEEVTWKMLEPVRKAADDSSLPMTVWPSNNIGVRFAGLNCLITFV